MRGKKEKAICKKCLKEFECLLIKKRQGKGVFCSRECYFQWRADNQENLKVQQKRHQLRYKYGITEDTFKETLKNQGEKCAICGNTSKLFVDHCHNTKRFRGLLCNNCNTGLGMFKDNVHILQAAIKYLKIKVK